eukprot:scaffold40798_cov63-Phaeocystis_antarctica.AAC.3
MRSLPNNIAQLREGLARSNLQLFLLRELHRLHRHLEYARFALVVTEQLPATRLPRVRVDVHLWQQCLRQPAELPVAAPVQPAHDLHGKHEVGAEQNHQKHDAADNERDVGEHIGGQLLVVGWGARRRVVCGEQRWRDWRVVQCHGNVVDLLQLEVVERNVGKAEARSIAAGHRAGHEALDIVALRDGCEQLAHAAVHFKDELRAARHLSARVAAVLLGRRVASCGSDGLCRRGDCPTRVAGACLVATA